MRNRLLVLAFFLIAGISRADVTILDNLSGFGSTTSITSSGNVVFTVPALYSGNTLSKFTLRINNTSAAGNTLTGASLQLSFNGSGTSTTLNAESFSAIDGGGSGAITFDLTSLPYTLTSSGNNTLGWTNLTFNGSGTAAYHYSSAGFTGSSVGTFVSALPSPGGGNIEFSLTAVPEPGTMLLGCILAAGSGAGFWWSRRKAVLETA